MVGWETTNKNLNRHVSDTHWTRCQLKFSLTDKMCVVTTKQTTFYPTSIYIHILHFELFALAHSAKAISEKHVVDDGLITLHSDSVVNWKVYRWNVHGAGKKCKITSWCFMSHGNVAHMTFSEEQTFAQAENPIPSDASVNGPFASFISQYDLAKSYGMTVGNVVIMFFNRRLVCPFKFPTWSSFLTHFSFQTTSIPAQHRYHGKWRNFSHFMMIWNQMGIYCMGILGMTI